MKYIVYALQFLTVVPVRAKAMPEGRDFSGAMAAFPAVGLVIGIVLAVANWLLVGLLPGIVETVLLVVLLILITGGLHLDGLADTFDALGSRKDRDGMLAVMRDSHIGTMGVLSLICAVLLKVYLLDAVTGKARLFTLLAFPVAGRWSMLLPLYFFKYARAEGKGKSFFAQMDRAVLLVGSAVALILVGAFLNPDGFAALAACGAAGLAFAWYINARIGGITGDTLGAVNEIAEIVFLATVVIFNE
jgi:adenosylcobinamide-GDP ribazoletransferase